MGSVVVFGVIRTTNKIGIFAHGLLLPQQGKDSHQYYCQILPSVQFSRSNQIGSIT
ncbi:hypothetical protein E2542_SST02822 [Spatholobus suberectus]|nr:hypothetical protein E2542_SST02822 [Spatholobus suberectus]